MRKGRTSKPVKGGKPSGENRKNVKTTWPGWGGAERLRKQVRRFAEVARIELMSSEAFETITLEGILAPKNLYQALLKVEANKGSAGVDGMGTGELRRYFLEHPGELTDKIRKGEYKPSPIKRVYIPKDNGEQRPLGIPTVIDRFVQQAVTLVLSREYEKVFRNMSYGFRPNRDCRMAVRKAMEHIKDGYVWVVDLDLRKFFDTVNHSKLIQLLSGRIKDGRVISLIHKFLRAQICKDGKVGKPNTIGTPQGGVISPLLANVLLNELDQKVEDKGIRAVRYADDAVFFARSRKAAQRILAWVSNFIEKKLILKVNQEKTKILKVGSPEVQFLGFSFTNSVTKKKKARFPDYKYFPVVHRKKRTKLKEKLRALTDRKAIGGIDVVKAKLRLALKGWANYFKKAVPVWWRIQTDSWLHRRIRQLLWKQWKKPRKRYEELKKRWKNAPEIGKFAYSSNRYWAMAKAYPIHQALSNQNLRDEGWYDLEKALRETR